MICNPKAWQALSTLLLVMAVAGFVAGATGLVAGATGLAWWALIGSGVTFAIELWLARRDDPGRDAPGGRR